MVRQLLIKDFRSRRRILTKKDYALEGDINYNKKIDLIDKELWEDIINLSDTVLIETTNIHGSKIKILNNLSNQILQDHIYNFFKKDFEKYLLLLIHDNFESSIFNALNGYYKESLSSLRNGLELIILIIIDDEEFYNNWMNSKEMSYGGKLNNSKNIKNIDEKLNNIASTKYSSYIRTYMHELSGYVHSLENKSNYDLWGGSTGPIFIEETFLDFYKNYIQVISILYLEVLFNIKNNKSNKKDVNIYKIISRFFDENIDYIPLYITSICRNQLKSMLNK